jgi:hypothetical protein
MSDSKEVEEAKRVLRAAYYQRVSREVADLVRAYFDGEYDDEDGQLERLHEACDSHVTYTADNYLTVFASEESDDGFDQMVELGGLDQQAHGGAGVSGTEVMQRWAYSTFEFDVLRLLQNEYGAAVKLLSEPMADGLDSDQRLEWLAENHGTLLFEDGDDKHYYVGVVDAGTATEVDLGLVTLGRRTNERRTVPEKFDIITGPERAARDPGTMTALRDALLEAGFFVERSSANKPSGPQISDEFLAEVRQLADLSRDEVSDQTLRTFLAKYAGEEDAELLAENAHAQFSRRSETRRRPLEPLARRDLANRGYHVLRGSERRQLHFAAVAEDYGPDNAAGYLLDLSNVRDPEGDAITNWTQALQDDWDPEEIDSNLFRDDTPVGLVRINGVDLRVFEYEL